MYSRRTFITSSVAGGAGLAGGTALLLQPGITSAQSRRVEPATALDEELARQARQAVRDMATRPGEGIRRLAGTLRVKAALGASTSLDADVRALLRRELRREGRATLLARPLEPAQLADEMKQFGIAYPLVPGPIDIAARSDALDLVLNTGFGAFLTELATALEAQADAIDKSPISAGPAPIQPAQFTIEPAQWLYSWWEICPILQNQRTHLEMYIAIVCTASMIAANPALVGTCVFVSSALASTLVQLYLYGC